MKRTIFAALCLLLLCACGAQSDAPALIEPVTISSDMATAAYGNIYDGTVLEGNILPQTQTLCFEASGRVGEPGDIARTVLFLCDPRNSFINGENITVDGGMTHQMIYHGDCGWKLER